MAGKELGMPHLERWSMVSLGKLDPYKAPEATPKVLRGTVTGHFLVEDGVFVTTTRLDEIDFEKRTAQTRNTKYTLGEPDPAWVYWCLEQEIDVRKITRGRKVPMVTLADETGARIGSISSGTLKQKDLLEAFGAELARLRQGQVEELSGEVLKAICILEEHPATEYGNLLQELVDELNTMAPPYCYFGAHEGDGSDFGFWPLPDLLEEDAAARDGGVVKVNDLADVPEDWAGYVMLVNDHGNVSLYETVRHLKEVWAIV